MLNVLSKTPVLVFLFAAMILIGYLFQGIQTGAGGPLLDMIWNGADAKARLAEMSAAEKSAHFWGTLINDTAYPLAYGGLFAGLAWRFGGQRLWLAVPALAVILADLAENTVQAIALGGNESFIGLKDILTPLKFGLFLVAVIIAIFCLIGAGFKRMKQVR